MDTTTLYGNRINLIRDAIKDALDKKKNMKIVSRKRKRKKLLNIMKK